VAFERGVDLSRLVGSGPAGRIVSEDVPAAPADGIMPAATVAAHQTAARLGIDLRDVRAVGRDPRVDRADVERHVREQLAATRPTAAPSEAPLLQTPSSTIPRCTGPWPCRSRRP